MRDSRFVENSLLVNVDPSHYSRFVAEFVPRPEPLTRAEFLESILSFPQLFEPLSPENFSIGLDEYQPIAGNINH